MFKILKVTAIACCCLFLLQITGFAVYYYVINSPMFYNPGVAVIGSADGPTAIVVALKISPFLYVLSGTFLLMTASAIGFMVVKRKSKRS